MIHRTSLSLLEPFDLRATLASGAAFGWGRYNRRGQLLAFGEPDADGWFTAPTYGSVIRLRQAEKSRIDIESTSPTVGSSCLDEFVFRYFRMEEKLSAVRAALARDPHTAAAFRLIPGLRLIRVEPFECLFTFLTSPQNRIPKIAAILNDVSRKYGARVTTPWGNFHHLPPPSRLARARSSALSACGLRYGVPQARNMIRTFKRIALRPGFFEEFSAPAARYEESRAAVQSTCPGAGPKVADCVCLFALGHLEAVPVDVHVFNTTIRLYRRNLRGLKSKNADGLPIREYRRIGDFYRKKFGHFAGYAQQYLFTAERLRRGFFQPR